MATAHELQDFRSQVREWFTQHTPQDWKATIATLTKPEYVEFQRSWLQRLSTQGFSAPAVPTEWGGGGYTVHQQAVIYEEWAASGAPPPPNLYSVSLNHIPATFLAHGTARQQEAYIRDAVSGVIWCQGFSEPGSGSDLASLRTRAVREGDEWVVTGQKIWSSQAHLAKYCILLARTGPQESRHRGISYFVLDMEAEGVEVRPIIQATGKEEFCEIFLDGVRIPAEDLVGEVDEGWAVAQTTLNSERGPIGLSVIGEIGEALRRIRDHIGSASGPELDRLQRLMARHRAVNSLALDLVDAVAKGQDDGGISSLVKVAFSDLLREVTDLGAQIQGDEALVDPLQQHHISDLSGDWTLDWLHSWTWSIAGGTNEIQRNIVSERVLGLPREPRPAIPEVA